MKLSGSQSQNPSDNSDVHAFLDLLGLCLPCTDQISNLDWVSNCPVSFELFSCKSLQLGPRGRNLWYLVRCPHNVPPQFQDPLAEKKVGK